MNNPIAYLLCAFFLYWLSEGLALIFMQASTELQNKILFKKFLKNLEKELIKNA